MKRLVAKVGTYQKDGQEKGEYVKIGALCYSQDGGEYVLMDPSVNLAGVLMKQNVMNAAKGKGPSDSVMVSVFSNDQQQQPQQQGQYQQPAPQQQGQMQEPTYTQPPGPAISQAPAQQPYQQQPQQQNNGVPF